MIQLLYVAFILSGAAGLMYESIWTRYLGLFVGHDAYAQIIVLVIFLGGMSLGAMAVSRRSERIERPLHGYLAIEFMVGCIGLVFHDAFQGATTLAYDRLFPALASPGGVIAAKWGLASLLILPQSVLLGATFPLMSAGVLRLVPDRPGRTLSLLYFANSLGAAAGVIIAGFYLVPLAGLPGTLAVAAMLNLVVALVTIGVVVAARRRGTVAAPGAAPAEPTAAGAERLSSLSPTGLHRALLAVGFGTAVASFVYEIDWIRMLSLVLGSATHSFELMLSAFILGLALGAFWIRARADRLADPVRTLGIVQWVMGALALATLPVYAASFSWVAALMRTFSWTDAGYTGFTLARYAICLLVMLPATFCAGMTLPLITRTLLAAGAGERSIGAVYGWNTLGSIVGVTIGGLVLMPLLGLKTMLIAGAAIDMLIGTAIFFLAAPRRPSSRRLALAGMAGTVVVAGTVALLVPLDQNVLTSGVFRSGKIAGPELYTVRFSQDGRTATVAAFVGRTDRSISLATNGKTDASLDSTWFRPCAPGAPLPALRSDAATQALLPLITLAHAPRATSAAVIGHGSGMSSHFLLGSTAMREVVTVEIEPEMVAGARIFYPANRRAFDDPRSRVVIDDAKSYFAAGQRRFDLILSEPSNPWVSGVSGLFTAEFYQRVKGYLTDDGVFGQWLHIYELDDGLVLSIMAALHQSFASYRIYLVSGGDLLVVASNRPTLPRPDWSVFGIPEIAADLCRYRLFSPDALDAMWLADRRALSPLLDSFGQPNSDFYPVLDLGAERRRFRKDQAAGFRALSLEWHNLIGSVSGRRLGPGGDLTPATLEVPRVLARSKGTALQSAAVPADGEWSRAVADLRYRTRLWEESLSSPTGPASWTAWVGQMSFVEAQRQAGMAGVVDSAFYTVVSRYLDRHDAPAPARDVVAFRLGMASWDFAAAAAAADRLVPKVLAKEPWISADELRDNAVIAKLHAGNVAGARHTFTELAPLTKRGPGDLRTQLLESYLDVAENGARRETAIK